MSGKLGRELSRLGRKIAAAPRLAASRLFGAAWFDLVRHGDVKVHDGRLAASGDVAVFLVFPADGVLPTHLRTLEYLAAKGFAPLVVSNLPLGAADRAALADRAWTVIERPNLGYDFGGYRQAILHLGDRLSSLTSLLLLNDSCWFPLPGSADWLDAARALDTDLVAAASNFGAARALPDDLADFRWSHDPTAKDFHYCSFALLLGPRPLADPDFRRFWKRFPMSGDKDATVRRGEIGFSQWLLRRGYGHAMTFDPARLPDTLARLTDSRLRQVAENTIVPWDGRMRRAKEAVLADPRASRAALTGVILAATAREGACYALADFAVNEGRFAFLKKSPAWSEAHGSDVTLRLAGALPGPEGREIADEALALRRRKAAFDAAQTREQPHG